MGKNWFSRFLMLATSCLLAMAGCARAPRTLSDEEAYQRFVGTWVNTSYPGVLGRCQMTVIRSDHTGEDWLLPDSSSAAGKYEIKVKKTWVDNQGHTYCQHFFRFTQGGDWYGTGLMRVDKAGKVWEGFFRPGHGEGDDYLEALNPGSQNYYIYYRKR